MHYYSFVHSDFSGSTSRMVRGPLEGIRVLEIAAYISGPYAGALLAGLGAEIVKIEPPEGEPFRIGKGTGSPFFAQYNAGKKSVAIDLKFTDSIEAIKLLLPSCDVLIENMRPGKLASLGLGTDECRRINPQLIYTSISGFGSGGPMMDRPAYDSIGQALGGLYTVMNDTGHVRLNGTCLADLVTAITTTTGILATLVRRERAPGQEGAHLDTSVLEAVSTLTIDAMTQALDTGTDPVRDTRHPQAQNFCLKTASGDCIVMHLSSSQKFWRALMCVVGREDLIDDLRFRSYADRTIPANYRVINEILEQEFSRFPRREWERRLAEADIPFAPALTMREVASHPQVEWLHLLDRGSNGDALVLPPWRIDGVRPSRGGNVPRVGEHTRQVLSEVLTSQELDSLAAKGVILQHDNHSRTDE